METIKVNGIEYVKVDFKTWTVYKGKWITTGYNFDETKEEYFIEKKPESAGELTKRNIISLINTIKGETKPFHWHEDYKREVIEKLEKLEAKKTK